MAALRPPDVSRPAGPMVPGRWRVRGRVRETSDTWTLEIEPANGAGVPGFAPGQFNMLYAFGAGEVPISICGRGGEPGTLLHTVRAVGTVTEAICASAPGTELGLRGPYGSAWPLAEAAGGDLLVIAGGVGFAPLRSALLAAIEESDRFGRVALLYGGREPEQLLYKGELAELTADSRLQALVTVDHATPDWEGNVGVVTTLLDRARFDPPQTTCLVCGPETMMRFAIRALREHGVEPDRIHVSIERNMKCAVTQCGRCQFGPTFACREGPVMRVSEIEPWLAVREV